MRILENTTKFHIGEPTAVAIGKFDGFHMGHQRLLGRLLEQKSRGLKTAVFTFVPSPAVYFGTSAVKELYTLEEKRRTFERAGVDYLIEFPFFKETADIEPQAFIRDVLVGRLNAKCVVAGDDVSFGKRGAGGCALLQDMARECGYGVVIIDKVFYRNREVSSTYVREAVGAGEMELAAKLLGAPYSIGGEIVRGKQLGRTLGIPTVNILPSKEKLLPPNGVYYSYVSINGERLFSITNIGTKPTVADGMQTGAESYLYDFDAQLYGERAEVYLLSYKRPERRFCGVEELKAQMQEDIADGRRYHGI